MYSSHTPHTRFSNLVIANSFVYVREKETKLYARLVRPIFPAFGIYCDSYSYFFFA
jgi:hypothetical protein